MRKHAEAALAEREAYFRALIEHSADAIMLMNVDGTILYGSPATSRILGYPLHDFVGHNAFEFIAPEDQAQIAQKILQIVDLPEATMTVHARVQHADGSWRDLEGRFSNLLADPAVGAIVNNYRDITERKRMEAALDEERALLARRVDDRTADLSTANAELARAARLKDEFLASMSHELRTPLNAVLGLSEALQEEIYGPLNDRQRRSLRSVEESGRHLLELMLGAGLSHGRAARRQHCSHQRGRSWQSIHNIIALVPCGNQRPEQFSASGSGCRRRAAHATNAPSRSRWCCWPKIMRPRSR